MSTVSLKKISKSYANLQTLSSIINRILFPWKNENNTGNFREQPEMRDWVLKEVDLDIKDGEILTIVGPSGCGKTTLLKIIAGIIQTDSGEITFDGEDVTNMKSGDRKIGMVFQSYALYPHLTSKENMLTYFMFKNQKEDNNLEQKKKELFKKTSEILGVDIKYLLDRKPPTLSGGEKQRVAIGRCITREPRLFLLDEPFTNLDSKIRETYRLRLKQLLNQLHTTSIFVTHDQHEAMLLGDRIAVMSHGKIEQVGSFDEVYDRPINMFVADFLSLSGGVAPINFFEGSLISSDLAGYTVGVRSEDTSVSENKLDNSSFQGTVTFSSHLFAKRESLIVLTSKAGEISCRMPIDTRVEKGMKVWIAFGLKHIFDSNTTLRLRSIEA